MKLPTLILALGATLLLSADHQPPNSEEALHEDFSAPELSKLWHINTGEWKIVDGVLRAKEILSENHSAAARCLVESDNAVYQLRFRFVDNGKGFHFGFDPAPGELDKKGHLYSVMVTPHSWKIMKHVDKNRPKEDPNEVLTTAETTFETGTWYTLRLASWEGYITASIEGKLPLKAQHRTFGVKKPTLVFRCIGDGVEIDDIHVWRQIPKRKTL